MTTSKSTSRWRGRKGDRPSERSLSAPKVGALGESASQRTETVYKAEPQGESAQHDEAQPDHCGMVNTVVVQRKIDPPKHPNGCGGTEPAKVRVKKVGVSRRREPANQCRERSEGSVIGDIREL